MSDSYTEYFASQRKLDREQYREQYGGGSAVPRDPGQGKFSYDRVGSYSRIIETPVYPVYPGMSVGTSARVTTSATVKLPRVTASESFRFRKHVSTTRAGLGHVMLEQWHAFPYQVSAAIEKSRHVVREVGGRRARAALTLGIGFLAGLGGCHEILDSALALTVGAMWAEPYWPRLHPVEPKEEKAVAFPQIRHWGLAFEPTDAQEAAYWKCKGARCCNVKGNIGTGKTYLSVALAIEFALETGKTALVMASYASELAHWYRIGCDIVQPSSARKRYTGPGIIGEELALPNGANVLFCWRKPEGIDIPSNIAMLVTEPQTFLNWAQKPVLGRTGRDHYPDLVLDFRSDPGPVPIGWAGQDVATVWLDRIVRETLIGKSGPAAPPAQAEPIPPTPAPLPVPTRSRSWRARLHAAWRRFVPSRASHNRDPL